MLALSFVRSGPRYAIVKAAAGRGRIATSELSMLHLGDVPEPPLPGAQWRRVRPSLAGICGSDTAAITGHASLYLDHLTSYPFVPGHEVVGVLEEDGSRVVVEPALGCQVRGLTPPCRQCQAGWPGRCENVSEGDLEIGLQTGYCASTGGGWGEVLVAHESQLHHVPEQLSDEAAVLIEPLACCVHAALRGAPGDTVVVLGAGTIGLLTVAAIHRLAPPRRLMVVAKYPFQREQALRLGADVVVSPDEALQRIRFQTGARRLGGKADSILLGGADVTYECTGSAAGLNQAVRFTRAGGHLITVGMPGAERVDWAPIWQRELTVSGAYAYGLEAGGRSSFDIALELAPDLELEHLCGPLFPLSGYRDAIDYALKAGPLNAVKVAFDLRDLRV
ncbi:MAG: zinc-dependent alcohol dehydrogenase [Candidatus Dormibacteraceae bacterium]